MKKILKNAFLFSIIIINLCMLTACGKKENNQNQDVSEDVYLQPIKDYLDGIKNKDIAQILKAYPDFMNMSNVITVENIDDVYKAYEKQFGANIKIEYSIGKATKVKDEDLGNIKAKLQQLYPNSGEINIPRAYVVTVVLTITGDGIPKENNEQANTEASIEAQEQNKVTATDSMDFYAYEYNEKWYMYDAKVF